MFVQFRRGESGEKFRGALQRRRISGAGNERSVMGMFDAFSSKDWNVIAVIFEKKDMYRVNGNRSKGGEAVKARDGAKTHPRTIFYAVFDQKRAFVEGDFGKGFNNVPRDVAERLKKELPKNETVQNILRILEGGSLDKAAKPLVWAGYPKPDAPLYDEEFS